MPLLDVFRAVRDHTHDQRNSLRANNGKLGWRFMEVFARTWDLGFTAFGGPPVHFQILHRRFVDGVGGKVSWIDEQTYQEIFAISQALPGPASTKMLFCIALIHAGLLPAILAFLIWSLPGALGMYALSLGVQKMPEQLPSIVYALLSGMNSSTVGIIALAAVQLAEKAIKDKLTRMLVIMGACAGLCYNALWYFPVLIVIGGICTLVWDTWLQQQVGKFKARRNRRSNESSSEPTVEEAQPIETAGPQGNGQGMAGGLQRRTLASTSKDSASVERTEPEPTTTVAAESRSSSDGNGNTEVATDVATHAIPIKLGLVIIAGFFISFIIIMVLRSTLSFPGLAFDLFANLYLAGTIIFGGGPVVIPLLSAYVVEPGWVTPRNFLLGLAIIQAFPGPNFNFAVFLAALALAPTGTPTIFGALLGFVGIFSPGLLLSVGAQSLWRVMRTKPWVTSILRGINATAVGLVFTAVYRLWEIGYLTPESTRGRSLADEPWWVVVAAVTYAESAWFDVPPAVAIVIGAVLGLGWYGAVGR